MVQFHLNGKGAFILIVGLVTFLLFWLSNNDRGSFVFERNSDVPSVRTLLVASVQAAELAGSSIHTARSARELRVRAKSNEKYHLVAGKQELVTQADLISHLCISKRLQLFTPGLSIHSEERDSPDADVQQIVGSLLLASKNRDLPLGLPLRDVLLPTKELTLWVDPLDATQELSENLLDYVSVMICASVQGTPLFGVLHFISSNTTFWGWMPSDVSPNLLSSRRGLSSGPLKILISRSHSSKNLEQHMKAIFQPSEVEVIAAGGTGYKMLQLAKRDADLYIHPSGARRWDLCAPIAVLEAVGGVVRTMSGQRFSFNGASKEATVGGIFAAATKPLYTKWKPFVAKLYVRLQNEIKST